MPTPRFTHIGLRTKDVAGATAFYTSVFGRTLNGFFTLPPPAAARGAPSHWLGFIEVSDPDAYARAVSGFVERGAQSLGPSSDKSGTSILRDPGGAVVALTRGIAWPTERAVWHQLHTADASRAAQNYAELFGWTLTETVDLGRAGSYRQFAWGPGEPDVGAIGDIAGRPELHAHWAFYLEVGDLDAALTRVSASGGKVVGSGLRARAARIAVCEDPQGAEFGLMQATATAGT